MWEVTIKHARTCDLGNKHFVFRRPNCTITFDPICQILHAVIDGNSYSSKELPSKTVRDHLRTHLHRFFFFSFSCDNLFVSFLTFAQGYIETLVRRAYVEWNSLEEIVGISSGIPLLTQGECVCVVNSSIDKKCK